MDYALHALPEPGKAVIAVGGLRLEFPEGRFAILTEGLSAPPKKKKSEAVTNRAKLGSYADLSLGTWWSTSTTAWAVFRKW